MSRANVELLRRANEAFNRGDVDGFLAFCGEDVEMEDLNNAPDLPRVTYGKEEARTALMAWTSAFEDFSGDIEEYIDIDERHVACLVRYRGRQRETGLLVEARAIDLWEVRENKLVSGTLGFPDRESALQHVQRPQ